MTVPDVVRAALTEQPFPLLFATLSGAHLYGFASEDSDFDVRGCHVLPAAEVLGLDKGPDTLETSEVREGVELDVVSHDAEKFFQLMLKRNGYVLEQVFSPLVLEGGEDLERLRSIAQGCITRHHAHHYLGFAANQEKFFLATDPPRVKPLLYTYRVLLTGIHLMRTGEVVANLSELNSVFRLGFLDDLIRAKREGPEKGTLTQVDTAWHRQEFQRLARLLEEARDASDLPDAPAGRPALSAFLMELRLRSGGRGA